ncbi:MAG: phage portal protein [Candidatus Helarchaeota archaeon]
MAKKNPKLTKTAHVRGLEIEYTPNADFQGVVKDIFTSEASASIETLYNVVKHSPEVNACIVAQIEDIMADYWRFASLSKNQKITKADLNRAKQFEIKSNYFQKFTDAAWDALVTGNGYILKLAVNKERIKSIIENLTHQMARKFGATNISKTDTFKILKQKIDNEVPTDLQVLKSSTVKINFDKTGEIISYQQNVRGEKRIYYPEDIIHLTTLRIGGQPYGYSQLEPLLSDIGTLIFAKEFAGKYFENDGVPYFIFKMIEESPNGRNYKLLKKELKELKKKSEKYKSMVLTGNVEFEQVNKFNKDMEFSKLIEHFTQKVFMGLGVPAHRVNYTVPRETAAQTIGKTDTGYYKRIAFIQKSWEFVLNRDLWSLFNVRKTFKRAYKIDEMREAEIIRILTEVGAITIEEARERIGMDPEIPPGTIPKPIGSDKRIDEAKDKKREQGIDQQPKDRTDNKLKDLKKSFDDSIEVSYDNFVAIVERLLGIGNFTKGKVLYIEMPNEYVLYFSDGNWKYKTKLKKTRENEVLTSNFIEIFP